MIQINRQSIKSHKKSKQFNNIKIIQLNDTHLGFQYTLDQLEQLVKKINHETPDMIVFTGDLIDDPNTFTEEKRLVSILQRLTAPHGKYWIYGNHDHGGYGTTLV